jgi:hypothetical protein
MKNLLKIVVLIILALVFVRVMTNCNMVKFTPEQQTKINQSEQVSHDAWDNFYKSWDNLIK